MDRLILLFSFISFVSDINCTPQGRQFNFNDGRQQNNRNIDSGQTIRLTAGKAGVHAGFLEIIPFRGGRWQLVCNDDFSWNKQAADVACRQMGYDSANIFEIGQNTFADFRKIDSETNTFADTLNIQCKGNEDNLDKCKYKENRGSQCDKSRHAVALVCNTPPQGRCPANYVPFKENCYRLVKQSLPFRQAQFYCQDNGNGYLAEIKNQLENNFLSSYALKEHPVVSFWTGGITGLTHSGAGLTLDIWFTSKDPIIFNKYYGQLGGAQSSGVALDLHDGYYFWKYEDLSSSLPFICQAPSQDIGCLKQGEKYLGSASQTKFGEKCLPWNTPGLPQLFGDQQNWNHNYCRNEGGGADDIPICYIDKSNYDECEVPICEGPRIKNDQFSTCPPCNCGEQLPPKSQFTQGRFTQDRFRKNPMTIDDLKLVNERGVDIVNVRVNGQWGGICANTVTTLEADVICRQLGYEYSERIVRGQSNIPISLFFLQCDGDENDISRCKLEDPKGQQNRCTDNQKAGVRCFGNPSRNSQIPPISTKSPEPFQCHKEHDFQCRNNACIDINNVCDQQSQCADGSDEDRNLCSKPFEIKLVGGPNERTGRILVRHRGVWGTVCDDHFGVEEAKVVCRMLRFPSNNAKVYDKGTEYDDKGPIWIKLSRDDDCTGNETHLDQCKQKHLWEHDYECSHSEDVAVSCE